MIIDSHTHLAGAPYTDDPIIFNYPDGGSFNLGIPRNQLNAESMLEDMDQRNIDKAIVLRMAKDMTNQELADLVTKYPDRLIGFTSVYNPKDPESVTILEEVIKKHKFKGIKFHPDLQSFSPADKEIIPLMKKVAELELPALFHCSPGGMRPGYFDKTTPGKIALLKSRVPEAKIIIAHMAYPRYLDLLTIAQIPGIYVETCGGLTAIAELHGLDFTAKYLRKLRVENVLFGSDWLGKQMGMEQQRQIELINKIDLTREEKDMILGENAAKLLKL